MGSHWPKITLNHPLPGLPYLFVSTIIGSVPLEGGSDIEDKRLTKFLRILVIINESKSASQMLSVKKSHLCMPE